MGQLKEVVNQRPASIVFDSVGNLPLSVVTLLFFEVFEKILKIFMGLVVLKFLVCFEEILRKTDSFAFNVFGTFFKHTKKKGNPKGGNYVKKNIISFSVI